MTEAMRDSFRSTGALASARAVNGAGLRWTPGPDELRLPSSEEEPVSQNTRQMVAITDGFSGLRLRWRGRRDVFVGADQFIYWDPAYDGRKNSGEPPMAPDVYVSFDVANRHRSSYVVWEEGKPPDFVLEVVSPSSRRRDKEEKKDAYAKMGVPEFFIYDPEDKSGPTLSGFELRAGHYRPLPQETFADGVAGVRSKVLGLCVCIRPTGTEPLDGSLCWYDLEQGEFLPTLHESEAKAEESDARSAESEARAVASAARAAESEAKAAASDAKAAESEARAAASDAKAAESEARAVASEAKAEESEARAAASEAKMAELEALIEKMRRG